METRTEAPEVVGSLATLSGFYADNSPAARRRLRSTIENQGVAVNEDFLAAAQTVLQVGAGAAEGYRQAATCAAWIPCDRGWVQHSSKGCTIPPPLPPTATQPPLHFQWGCSPAVVTLLLYPLDRLLMRFRATWMRSLPAAKP